MDSLPSELVIVGGVGLLILAALILVKWGKQILTVLLVAGVGVVLALVAWTVLDLGKASTEGGTLHDVADIARLLKSEPEPTYTVPASGGGFLAGVLVALLAVALGVGGYFFARWKLAEWAGLPTKRKRRKVRDSTPVVYVVQGQDLDALPWLEELAGWDENDFSQF